MAAYLERYRQGEHVQVWNELVALGGQVRQPPFYNDAYAVAQETMRRARHNVELLAARLKVLGFKFRYSDQIFVPFNQQQRSEFNAFERQIGPLPLSLRAWAEIGGEINFMGSYPRLCYYAENTNPFLAAIGNLGRVEQIDLKKLIQPGKMPSLGEQSTPELNNLISALQNLIGIGANPLADRLNAQLGQKTSDTAIPEDDRITSDPLVVDFNEISVDFYEEWQEYEEAGKFVVHIAPDRLHKANYSGSDGFEIDLPNAAADAPLLYTEWGDLTFVEYLRLSFEWAGFPGLRDYPRRDEALLATLKAELLSL